MKRSVAGMIVICGLVAPVTVALAEDIDDVTMQVVGPDAFPDAVTQRIELPTRANERARERSANGLETANRQRERNQERMRTNAMENEQRQEMNRTRRELREQLQEQREEMNRDMRRERSEFRERLNTGR